MEEQHLLKEIATPPEHDTMNKVTEVETSSINVSVTLSEASGCGIRSRVEDNHAYSEGRRRRPEEYETNYITAKNRKVCIRHKIVMDWIDIDPDRSQAIWYCEKCGYTSTEYNKK